MAANTGASWRPDWAVAPGDILSEALEEREMSQAELARRTNRPLKTINEIVKGKAAITPETAIQLELVMGIPASFWMNLESRYREHLAREEVHSQFERDSRWLENFPVKEMVRQGLVSRVGSPAAQMKELLRYFGVSSPAAWERHWSNAGASFHRSFAYTSSPYAVAAWLRHGEIESAQLDCRPFDAERLERSLSTIRSMTRLAPLAFLTDLVEVLQKCGVALVLTRDLPGTHLSGATRWISPSKALIQLSLRHRSDDQFWFALFHELGHVLQGGRRQTYIHSTLDAPGPDADEEVAHQFARDWLIPEPDYRRLLGISNLSPKRVKEFAEEVGISPGIVIGRLQRDGQLAQSAMNYLKKPYPWPDEAYR